MQYKNIAGSPGSAWTMSRNNIKVKGFMPNKWVKGFMPNKFNVTLNKEKFQHIRIIYTEQYKWASNGFMPNKFRVTLNKEKFEYIRIIYTKQYKSSGGSTGSCRKNSMPNSIRKNAWKAVVGQRVHGEQIQCHFNKEFNFTVNKESVEQRMVFMLYKFTITYDI